MRKTGRWKGRESAFTVCVWGEADGFLSNVSPSFNHIFKVCLGKVMNTTRWLLISKFMVLAAAPERTWFSRETQASFHWCVKWTVIMLSAWLKDFLGSRKCRKVNSHSYCDTHHETVWRNFFGCCVSTTIILSSPPWKGRCYFRNNPWFLNAFWTGNSFKARVITSRLHLYEEKSITNSFPETGPRSTCLHWLHMLPAAVFSTAKTVSPSSLAGESYRTCCSTGASF